MIQFWVECIKWTPKKYVRRKVSMFILLPQQIAREHNGGGDPLYNVAMPSITSTLVTNKGQSAQNMALDRWNALIWFVTGDKW